MRPAILRPFVFAATLALALPALAPLLPVRALPALAAAPGARVQEWEIAEGTTALLVEDHRVPLVDVSVEFGAGSWSPWVVENHAEEAFEIQMHDARGELRRRADRLALDIGLEVGARSSTVSLSCRKEDLGPALQLVRDILANRDFDRRELSRRKQQRKLGWQASQKEPDFMLKQAAARMLFHEGDPRRRPYETPPPLLTDPEKLAAARNILVRLPGRVIGFAGDIGPEEARSLAAGLLPPVTHAPPGGTKPVLAPITPAAERATESIVRMTRLTQVYFGYGRESISYKDEDYAAWEISDHVLGGHFNSRLMVSLRQEGGETYGAGTESSGGLDPGVYAMWTFTRTGNVDVAEQKLKTVLAKLHEDGITEEERSGAAGYLVGRRAFDVQSPKQILGEAMWERRLGLPAGFRDQLAQRAAALPLAEINAFIKKYYDPSRFSMIKVMAK